MAAKDPSLVLVWDHRSLHHNNHRSSHNRNHLKFNTIHYMALEFPFQIESNFNYDDDRDHDDGDGTALGLLCLQQPSRVTATQSTETVTKKN